MHTFAAAVLLVVVTVLVAVQAAPNGVQPKAVQKQLDARDALRTEVLHILDLHNVPHTRDGYRVAFDEIIQLQPTDSFDTIMMMSVLDQLLATFPNGPFE